MIFGFGIAFYLSNIVYRDDRDGAVKQVEEMKKQVKELEAFVDQKKTELEERSNKFGEDSLKQSAEIKQLESKLANSATVLAEYERLRVVLNLKDQQTTEYEKLIELKSMRIAELEKLTRDQTTPTRGTGD